jgi:chloride channel protein, CIC family
MDSQVTPTQQSAARRDFLEIPLALRAFVRARESGLLILGAIVGVVGALVVEAMNEGVRLLHTLFFGIPFGDRLSATLDVAPWRVVVIPVAGGLVFGATYLAIRRLRPGREVDPIEANALHGGRMSIVGSLVVALQTVWSCGVGASVGLEAGFTQLSSGCASWLGQKFRLRRRDLRGLVGCGAAAGISAAFNAPLAGAFYAFELVIASYSVGSLAAVGAAALTSYVVSHQFQSTSLGLGMPFEFQMTKADLGLAVVLGACAAGLGICIMQGVALCERLLRKIRVPRSARPALGGLVVGLLALAAPQILSSGHGAMNVATMINGSERAILLLFVLKAIASIISIGTGFRGGLFFASLLVGALGGRLFADGLSLLMPGTVFDPSVYAIMGLSALSTSVIGGPLTMTFIALETSGDLWLTTVVLVAVIVSMQLTREAFGYSFATWRFHLRGETIRSAADVGWIRELTVRRLMRPDVKTVPAHTTIGRFRLVFPIGSTASVVAVDEQQHYAGMVLVAEAHGAELDANQQLRTILHTQDVVLTPNMTVDRAIALFEKGEAESLAVVESDQDREVIGLLTEAYALRRYADELDLRRQDAIST